MRGATTDARRLAADLAAQLPPGLPFALVNLCIPFTLVCALSSFYMGPVALTLVVLLVLAQGAVASEVLGRHKAVPWLLLFWVSSVIGALYVGSRNYHLVYAPYKLASKGRDKIVPANASASGLRDGRTLTFDASFLLDGERSVGVRAFGATYCAAPVVSVTTASALNDYPKVQIWAVGQDCCGARAEFLCDDAGEEGVHGGVVLHRPRESDTLMGSLLAPRSFDNGWHRAIQASCALHEMQSATDPVLVAWTKHPDDVLSGWRMDAIIVWLASSFLHLVVTAVAWSVVVASFRAQEMEKKAEKMFWEFAASLP
mmetsp:Transcript_18013/g.48307  ORF Transcript_18013/g.48307 Transcript_18013/m.48307 type:complete len:314 (-) Transcript_18013:69-1010(-)